MARILVIDSFLAKCIKTFKACIEPEINADIDYEIGLESAMTRFKQQKYDLVVIESLVVWPKNNLVGRIKSFIKRCLNKLTDNSEFEPDIWDMINASSDFDVTSPVQCIPLLRDINPDARYIVTCHLRSGFEKEERKMLEDIPEIIEVLNYLSSDSSKKKMLKIIANGLN